MHLSFFIWCHKAPFSAWYVSHDILSYPISTSPSLGLFYQHPSIITVPSLRPWKIMLLPTDQATLVQRLLPPVQVISKCGVLSQLCSFSRTFLHLLAYPDLSKPITILLETWQWIYYQYLPIWFGKPCSNTICQGWKFPGKYNIRL